MRMIQDNLWWTRVSSEYNDTNELIYKTDIDSQAEKANTLVPKGKGGGSEGDELGSFELFIHTTVYKVDNQQGPTV